MYISYMNNNLAVIFLFCNNVFPLFEIKIKKWTKLHSIVTLKVD